MPFEGARLKVQRAEQHIADVEAAIRAFVAADYYSLRVEHDAKTRQNALKFGLVKSPPMNLGLVVGDAAHNLRTALDYLTSDIVFATTGVRDKYTKFPIHETRQELVGTLNNGKIKHASADVSDHILNVVKPYKGGNDLIYGLHRLDIVDKHRIPIVTVEVTALHGVDAEGKGKRPFRIYGTMVLAAGAKEMPAFMTDGEIHIYDHGKPTFQILFEKGLAMEGEPVVPTLLQVRDAVVDVIAGFEALF